MNWKAFFNYAMTLLLRGILASTKLWSWYVETIGGFKCENLLKNSYDHATRVHYEDTTTLIIWTFIPTFNTWRSMVIFIHGFYHTPSKFQFKGLYFGGGRLFNQDGTFDSVQQNCNMWRNCQAFPWEYLPIHGLSNDSVLDCKTQFIFYIFWPHRLQDHNDLVLKKDVEIFLATDR